MGEIAGCSFCQNKTFTTGGEGGMVTTDDTGSILYVNQAQADFYGYEPAELVGKSWTVFYDAATVESLSGEIMRIKSSKR